MTRGPKNNLYIHTTHNIFSSYNDIKVIDDQKNYGEPQRLLFNYHIRMFNWVILSLQIRA